MMLPAAETVGRVDAVNIARLEPLTLAGRTMETGIFKRPVAASVAVTAEGLAGDAQADRTHHGGSDKAVNVYPAEHFAYWSEKLGRQLSAGAFGENLTTSGLTEETVAIGDIFRIGTALLQVSQPRQPCGKLAARHQQPKLVRWVVESGYTGFYLRCLEPGVVQAGDAILLYERCEPRITVAKAVRIVYDRNDRDGAARLLALPALAQSWREDLQQRRDR